MKQILQSLKDGVTEIAEIPCPQLKAGHVLIRTERSLISSGTEKMLVDFGKSSLLDKARQQPDKVRQVFDKMKTVGVLSTLDAVRSKLDQLLPMGYCNVGIIIGVGKGVTEFNVGDRVVSNGAHAEIVHVPKNLCCKVPASITVDEAVFTVLGAIALQGLRLAAPTLGESFAVIGLGLIGLLTVQLLRAQGCRVLAIDLNPERVALAKQFGATGVTLNPGIDLASYTEEFSRQRGMDGVLITASTSSNDPVHQAATMCRQRGRIVLVGVTGLKLSRDDFYKKELSFQVSCSYGPGRYDSAYEEQGHDYPIGFVRWTEQRNFEAFLDALALQIIDVKTLITHRIAILDAANAYDLLTTEHNTLGILLTYPVDEDTVLTAQTVTLANPSKTESSVSAGIIGAGNYASRVLLPAFKQSGANLQTIACSAGVSGAQAGKKFGFEQVTTDTRSLFSNPALNTIIIASRHDTHAEFICEALKQNKNVFVEKPLCLTLDELTAIENQYRETPQRLMIGFNRRFAPQIQKVKSLLNDISAPKSFIMTVNPGQIPSSHWTQDSTSGGGRIIGEACHFIDLLRYLSGSSITSSHITRLGNIDITDDKASITLTFQDGSFGVIHYLANGHQSFPKERLEIFCAGKILQLDNFRKLRGYGWPNFQRMNLMRQDKGQNACVQEFVNSITNGLPAPIPVEEIFEVTKITLQISEST